MSLSGLIATLRPGQSVFLPGSTGEPAGLMEALAREGAAPLDIMSSYLPGINHVPLDRIALRLPVRPWRGHGPKARRVPAPAALLRHLHEAFERAREVRRLHRPCLSA